MRIAFVTPLVSRKAGGLFVSVRQLAQALSARPNIALKTFGAVDEHIQDDLPAWSGVDVMCLSTRGPKSLFYMPGLGSALRDFQPDIVHVHGLWTFVSKVSRDFCSATRTPYIIAPRGSLDVWAIGRSRLKKTFALWAYEKTHLKHASVMHALAESEYRAFRRFDLMNPVAIVPNGINAEARRRGPAPGWLSEIRNHGKRVLLFLGRLHPKKGVVELLRAAGMLKREGFRPIEDWQFVIAGWDEVNYLDAIKAEAASAGIQAQVTIAGPLHGAEKESTLGNVDAFVLPSYSEGLPMAVLEAWSWALPTLITPECNLEIAFERGAALKISNDPARLAADLRTFFGMTVDERTKMGRAALDLVNEKFSWGEIATDLERVYAWMKNKTAAAPSCVRLT